MQSRNESYSTWTDNFAPRRSGLLGEIYPVFLSLTLPIFTVSMSPLSVHGITLVSRYEKQHMVVFSLYTVCLM